jgi:hypothetical protein
LRNITQYIILMYPHKITAILVFSFILTLFCVAGVKAASYSLGTTLTVTATGAGNGSVVATGVNCYARAGSTIGDCDEVVELGDEVTLIATASSTSNFISFSGGGCTTSPCTFTPSDDVTVVANFAPKTYVVQVAPAGSGSGSVSGTGISCGSDCTHSLTAGQSITLTATAASGSTFISFSGGGCTTSPCTFTPTDDTTVVANFALNSGGGDPATHVVQVSLQGSGSGSVSGTGISCGSDCTHSLTAGQSITLTASSLSNSTFVSFSGGGCTTSPCTFTPSDDVTVVANFALKNTHQIEVSLAGNGSGTVTGTGISCGSDCSATLIDGQSIALTAVAHTDSEFVGFSGGPCSTTPCTFTPSDDTTIVATFTLLPEDSGDGDPEPDPTSTASPSRRRRGSGISSNPNIPSPSPTPTSTPVCVSVPSTTGGGFIRTLRVGSKGVDVTALQRFLNAKGYRVALAGSGSPGKESTTFGPATKAALIKFQIANNIKPASGIFGPLTRTKVNAMAGTTGTKIVCTTPGLATTTPAVSTPTTSIRVPFTRTLQVGSVGADVKALQVFLNTKGYRVATTGTGSPGKEGTTFGPATKAALIRYQIANSIKPASGILGPLTRTKINASP